MERQCKERSSSRVQGRAEGPCEPSRLTRDGSYASQPLARGKTRKERLHAQVRTPPSLCLRSGLIAKLGDAGTGEGEPSEETWQFMGYYEGSKQGRTLKAHRDNQTARSEKAPLREASPPPTLLDFSRLTQERCYGTSGRSRSQPLGRPSCIGSAHGRHRIRTDCSESILRQKKSQVPVFYPSVSHDSRFLKKCRFIVFTAGSLQVTQP